jgi:hypothetical protein
MGEDGYSTAALVVVVNKGACAGDADDAFTRGESLLRLLLASSVVQLRDESGLDGS